MRRTQKIAYVIEPPYPTFAVNDVLAMRAQGASVTVFNSYRPFNQTFPEAQSLCDESIYFPPGYRGVFGQTIASILRTPIGFGRSVAFLVRHRLPWRLLLLSAYYAGVVRERQIEHVHAIFGTTPGSVAALTSWLAEVPYSFASHAYDVYRPNPGFVDKINGAAFVQCGSRFIREYLLEHHRGVDASRLAVVYLGVDLAYFRPQQTRAAGGEECTIVSVARLETMKGLAFLIDACALLAGRGLGFRCLIAGEGPLRAELRDRIDTLGLDEHVALLGHQPPERCRELLGKSDVFCLPSIVEADGNREGMPVAVMEAMAMGLPVVSTLVAAIPEIVEDGRSGLLVPDKDPAALASALARLLVDPELRRSMGQHGRAVVTRDYDLPTSARRLRDLMSRDPGGSSAGRRCSRRAR